MIAGPHTRNRKTVLWATSIFVALVALYFLFVNSRQFLTFFRLKQAEAQVISSKGWRTTAGRIISAPYEKVTTNDKAPADLGRAEILVLSLPDSNESKYLQALIDVETGNWTASEGKLSSIPSSSLDTRMANLLGVVFLQRAETDPLYLFRALDEFERAEKLNPKAAEPHFNRVIALRRLHLVNQEHAEETAYSKLESSGPWHEELMTQREESEESVAARLQQAVDGHNDAAALEVFNKSPEITRNLAMRYGMNPDESRENEGVAIAAARMVSDRYGDETLNGMLAGLHTANRAVLVKARKLIADGADLYLKGDLKGSDEAYTQAEEILKSVPSPFDHLWLDLNRAITEVRISPVDVANNLLSEVVTEGAAQKYKWIVASALSTYGSLRPLNSSFPEMSDRLNDAVRICDEIGAPKASARARFYIFGQTYNGGDLDGTLTQTLELLKVVEPTEHLRVASVLSYLDAVLYKKGFLDQAIMVGEEAVAQAAQSHNPQVMGGANVSLALIAELSGQGQRADAALAHAESYSAGLQGPERIRSQVSIQNAHARILLHRGNPTAAAKALEQSRDAVNAKLAPVESFRTETLSLLGDSYAQEKRFADARAMFAQAVDAAERDNAFAKSPGTQAAFDDPRRELYESAIEFEYEQGSKDAAWTYLQKYRAKAFIEMLAQYNPEVQKVHSIALDRNQAQQAIPGDMQVVEYMLLPDRILTWVLTKNKFETRSLPINRPAVEQKVQEFLSDLRAGRPEISNNAELYNILIGPIKDLLETDKPLAIIPDRALHGLPFGAIKCPENRYLIEYYPLIESPTLTHLLTAEKGEIDRDSIVTFGSRAEDTAEMREMGAIKTIYRKVTPFTGPQVTKAMFLDEMEHAAIFHYAGHSAHDAADPLRSAILLDGDKGGPNSVTAVDIVSRKLRPNALVILSSCESSVGNSKDGVGIRGLTSAFLVSGASAVVGSLWTVESTSTSELMIGFHKAFATEHLPIAQALRKAQLAFIQSNSRHSHPYYWSGFVVTSNFSALR